MLCPTCSSSLHIDRSDVNRENSAQYYDRAIYHCTSCDTWVTIETPVAED